MSTAFRRSFADRHGRLAKCRPIPSKSAVPKRGTGGLRGCAPTPRTADYVGRKLSVVRFRVTTGASPGEAMRVSASTLPWQLLHATAANMDRVCSDGLGEHARLMIHVVGRSEPSGGLRVRDMDHVRRSQRFQQRNVVDAETCIAGDDVGTCSYGSANVTPRGIRRVRLLLLASWTLLERRRSGVRHLDTAVAWMAWTDDFLTMSPRATKRMAE